jgi:hypothetical protein
MGQQNRYLDKFIPALYQKQTLDVMIYTYIDGIRSLIPGMSVENLAVAFMKRYEIDEDLLSVSKITNTYWRIQKELHDERKTQTTRPEGPKP